MKMIKIGPAGIGGAKEAEQYLEEFHTNKLEAAEVTFTYSNYLTKEDAIKIGKIAKKLGITLSIHGSYYINLNSEDKSKIEKSKERILGACKIAEYLEAKYVVFHAGYYGKKSKEETYEKIKEEISDLQKTLKKNKWKVKLAPETTGKNSVFGDLDETLQLVKDTGCHFCIDFAHLKALNQGETNFKEHISKIKHFSHVHCHYSGINYGPKGERNHIPIEKDETRELIKELKKQKVNCTLICEAPNTIKDSIEMKKILISI